MTHEKCRVTRADIDEVARLHRAAEDRARALYERKHGPDALSRRDVQDMGLEPLPREANGLPPGTDTAP